MLTTRKVSKSIEEYTYITESCQMFLMSVLNLLASCDCLDVLESVSIT